MNYKMYNWKDIAFHDIAVNKDRAWFCNIGYNALFQIDLLTGKLKLLDFFPNDSLQCMELYSPIAYLENKLYIGPRNGNSLLIYDLDRSSFVTVDLDFEKYGEKKNYNSFSRAETIRGKVYFFPGRFHAIVELDPASGSVSYIDNWYSSLEPMDKKMIFNNVHIGAEGNCLLPCWRSQDIVKLNVCSREYEILRPFQKPYAPLSDAVEIKDNIMFSYKDERGVGDYRNKNFISLNDMDFKYTGGMFFGAYEDWLYIVPMYGNAIMRYQCTTGTSERIYTFPDSISAATRWIPYKNSTLVQKVVENTRLAIFSVFDGKLILVDMETGNIQDVEFFLNNEDKLRIQNYLYAFMSTNSILETEHFGLNDFIEIIKTQNGDKT